MSDQDNGQVSTLQRPISDDQEEWKDYWEAQGQPWRTEPEIDAERQKYLVERRSIKPDIERGIYPFKDIKPKLTRADIEWLLVTHENERELLNHSERNHPRRYSLDLRGSNLRHIDLSGLPLTRLLGGFVSKDQEFTIERHNMAAIFLEDTNLKEANLEGSLLRGAHLERAVLHETTLRGVNLRGAHLEGADLFRAQLQDAYLRGAHLQGANLRGAFLDTATNLTDVTLSDEQYGIVSFADIHWGDVNLNVINWSQLKTLGDEREAKEKKYPNGIMKDQNRRLNEYQAAIRSNRQLTVTLQNQGMNEEAAHFAYRAQKLHRIVLRLQKKFGRYLFSLLLDLLAGYGYRPGRSVLWYLAVIFGFALAYFAIGHLPFFPDAFVFSLTSFHGRGFFPGLGNENSLHNPLVITAAFEAVVGLLIEISFIATFTQRFFGK